MSDTVLKLEIPTEMRRGHFRKNPDQARASAVMALDHVKSVLGIDSFENIRFLDLGCGDKFSDALINNGIPIREYHGVDVNGPVIAHLKQAVSEPNFTYHHIDVYNEMYNKKGAPLSPDTDLGAAGRDFDVVGLFSVFTHLAPDDYKAMLGLARRYIAPDGRLVFTSFIVEGQDEVFVDQFPDRPLFRALYNGDWVRDAIAEAGWKLESITEPKEGKMGHKKRTVVCSPA